MKQILIFIILALFGFLPQAFAAETNLDSSFSLQTPGSWETMSRDVMGTAPKKVTDMLDCLQEDPSNAKLLGWKLADDGKFMGAFCISFQQTGMGKLRNILKTASGDNRQKASDKFIDTFASKLHEEYGLKRNMSISGLSADLMDADNDVIMVMDGKIKSSDRDYMRSLLIFLHNDSLLNISFIHGVDVPASIIDQLDAIPVSLKWNQ